MPLPRLHFNAYQTAEMLTPELIHRESDDGVELKKMKKEENSEDAGEDQENDVKKEESDDS